MPVSTGLDVSQVRCQDSATSRPPSSSMMVSVTSRTPDGGSWPPHAPELRIFRCWLSAADASGPKAPPPEPEACAPEPGTCCGRDRRIETVGAALATACA